MFDALTKARVLYLLAIRLEGDTHTFGQFGRVPGVYMNHILSCAYRRVKPSKTVDVPVLVIGGKDDAAIGTHLFKNIEKMVPDVQLHFLSNCSHWVQQDRCVFQHTFLFDN